jgi:O-antigen/teichoic acid export membrane protein
MLFFLPDAVGFVIFPKSAGTSAREMNTFTPRVFKYVLALTVIGAVFLAIVAKPLIPLVFSDAFTPSYVPMLVLLPGAVLLGAAKVLTNEIAGRGHPGYNSRTAGFCLVIPVAADLLLIPRHGASGAAAASTLAYTASFLLALWLLC